MWRVALCAVVGVTAVALLVVRVGPGAVGAAFADLAPATVAAVVALEVVALAGLAQVHRTTFAVTGGVIGRREGAVVALGALSLTQLLPGGGVVGGLYAARRFGRAGADPVAAAATVVVGGLVTMGTLGLLVSAATTVGAASTPGYVAHAVVAGAVTAVLVGGLVATRALLGRDGARRRVTAWLAARRGGAGVLPGVAGHLETHRDLLRRPAVLVRPAAWAAVRWTADVAVLAVLLAAVGATTPLLVVIAAYAVANLVAGLPLTPGGIGIVELGATGTLVAAGTDLVLASAAVLAYRAVAIGTPLVLAVPVLSLDARASRRASALGGHP